MSRFEERLAEDRVVVGDGGTGALLTAAVPRLRVPEEANLKAPEAVIGVHLGFIRGRAPSSSRRTRSARTAASSSAQSCSTTGSRRSSSAASSSPARRARSPASQVLVGGVDRPARRSGGQPRSRGRLRRLPRAGAAARGARRRPLHGRDVLRPGGARDRRSSAVQDASRRCRSSRSSPSTRTPRRWRASRRATPSTRLGALGVVADRRELRPRPAGSARRARRDGGGARTACALTRAAERRAAEPFGRPHRLPERDARLLRRVRRPGAQPRRADHRRLLRDDAGADRRDSRRGRGAARAARAARSSSSARSPRSPRPRRADEDAPASASSRPGSGSSRSSSTRPRARTWRRCWACAARLKASGVVHVVGHQRQPDGARAAVRAHGGRGDRADGRDRDDPARHAARLVDHGAPVPAPRRARGGRPERPRGHRRPAARRRLPRLERRLRGGRDRPRDAPRPSEPRGGLLRQGDRRADLVLRRRRGEPVRGGPRPRGRALPAQGRRGRALRHDPGALRHRRTSTASSTRSAASPRFRCSSASGRSRASSSRSGSTTRCRGSRSPRAIQERLAAAGPDAARRRLRARAGAGRGGADARRRASTSSRPSRSPTQLWSCSAP